MKNLQTLKAIWVLFLLASLAACGSGNDGASNTGSGRVSLLITDGPTTDFDQINITLQSISFLSEDDGKETIVFEEEKVINLLSLQNYSNLLTTTLISAGTYNKIRLHVSQVELVKLNPDGSILSTDIAKLPANGKIDLNPKGSFDVVDGGHLMIELDVDAEKSIHIVQTGNGKFIFLPVIFVNILGDENLKLVILNGRVFSKSASSFLLCKVDAVEVNEHCLGVLISDNTVVQDNQVTVVASTVLEDNDVVTVLGKANSQSIKALHVVIAADDTETNNLALFTGASDSDVSVDNVFEMTTDDNNDVVPPGTALSITIAEGARVFDAFGTEVGNNSIVDGSDVDFFGLAVPDLSAVEMVSAAFVIVDNDSEADKISGAIVAIDVITSQVTITVVSVSFSGDVCVDVQDADMYLLASVGGSISSTEISIADLEAGMTVDAYGKIVVGQSCMSADVVLVTEN